MHHRTKRTGRGLVLTLLAALALAPAAEAQCTAPPPEPGFEYIFDGTATGSDASFDKWLSANGATAVTLDPELGDAQAQQAAAAGGGAFTARRARADSPHPACAAPGLGSSGHPRMRGRGAARLGCCGSRQPAVTWPNPA